MKRFKVILLLLVATVILAACSQAAPESVTHTIDMTEFSYTPQTIEARVGQQVTLELVNKGVLEHEIMFGRNVMRINNRPDGFQTDMFGMAHVEPDVMMMQEESGNMGQGAHGAEHSGFMVILSKADDKATLTFTVTEEMEGEWEIGCFSQEGVHYDAGMKGTFVVKP
jgi:plastocyanin